MPQNSLTTWSCEVRWPIKNKISPLLQDLWPQGMARYGQGMQDLWPTLQGSHLWRGKLTHNVTWLCEHIVIWQTKNKIFSLAQHLRPTNLVGWWFIMRSTHPQCYMTLWPRGHIEQRDKLKTKYLLFRKAYGYHTC